jgi:hypothetical protein
MASLIGFKGGLVKVFSAIQRSKTPDLPGDMRTLDVLGPAWTGDREVLSKVGEADQAGAALSPAPIATAEQRHPRGIHFGKGTGESERVCR